MSNVPWNAPYKVVIDSAGSDVHRVFYGDAFVCLNLQLQSGSWVEVIAICQSDDDAMGFAEEFVFKKAED